jgi:hypothetical protein
MSFLQTLGTFGSSLISALNDQAGVGENQSFTLDSTDPSDPNRTVDYGSLGKFANKIDHTEERNYLSMGTSPNQTPHQRQILSQAPEMTVVVKKRMFSTLASNFRPELMDDQEKLFYRASKRLFQNKCKVIATYEKLTKVERIVKKQGVINQAFLPLILDGVDGLDAAGFSSIFSGSTRAVLDELKKVSKFSSPTYQTEWSTARGDSTSPLGQGTGTFELTVVGSATTNTSIKFGQGSASLEIPDPYRMMIITKDDVEKAIRESANTFKNNGFFKYSQVTLEEATEAAKQKLNALRTARGASQIRFFVNSDTLLFKKVRALIDEEGREISFSFDGGFLGFNSQIEIDATAMTGQNGLRAGEETSIFRQVVNNIYVMISEAKSTQQDTFQWNRETNYVRRKMMLHFGNKPIIQPMDAVHIFFSSGTTLDPKTSNMVSQSFSNKGELFQALDKTIGDIEGTIDNISATFGNSKDTYAVTEKNAIAGESFPMWLWNMVRSDFTENYGGTHCFAGIVNSGGSSHADNGGFYTLRASISDNTAFFTMGQVNFNPSVDIYNGALYDPLTPFNLEFDKATGLLIGETPQLLNENELLLNSGHVKFKNGAALGTTIDPTSFKKTDGEKVGAAFRRKYDDPDGFVYRWKEGIQSLTLLTEPHPTGDFSTSRSPSMSKDPFSGQDVMNVLSILVTGQPYNFNTFLKAAISSGNFTNDSLLNNSSYNSFLKGLLSDLSANNATWGNFIPFKKLSINESGYRFLASGEFDISKNNTALSQLLSDRASKFDRLTKLIPSLAQNPQYFNVDGNGNLSKVNSLNLAGTDPALIPAVSAVANDLVKINFDLAAQQKAFQDSISNANINQNDGKIKIYGDSVEFDPSLTGNNNNDDAARQRAATVFRKKLNYLTQRKLWKVKANDDQNLFIVDDSYDKNYDIAAFEKAIAGNLGLFNSTYLNIDSQITMVASLLGLEVFADSQGHMNARVPQYNRIPSSVFFSMLDKKNQTGQQLFPEYLESLFLNQVRGLTDKLEIIEDEIRLRTAALGFLDDVDSAEALSGATLQPSAKTKFTFVTDATTGLVGGNDFRKIIDQSNPDLLEDREKSTALKNVSGKLKGILSSTTNFDIIQRINLLKTDDFANLSKDQSVSVATRVEFIGNRLQQKTGNPSPTLQDLFSHPSGSVRSQLDIVTVMNQISLSIRERADLIKLFANALKNLDQGLELNAGESGKASLAPFTNKHTQIPSIIEHMIEDEDEDDIGYGSGKRYVVEDHQIISFTLTEKPPEHTGVEVTGLFGEGQAGPPSGFDLPGGNPISSAWAVDFDMWRMYGFRAPNNQPAPYLSDPVSQCAPFATFLLNKARAEIFQAECTLVGNEFIQPGEVLYFRYYDLLFYTESVQHSFTYNGQFQTSCSLKYGRNPGEYIPTMMDIVGKGLYSKKNQADLIRHNRHGHSSGDVPVGVIVFDANNDVFDVSSLVEGTYGEQNRKTLSNILLAVSGNMGTNQVTGRNAVLELRCFKNSKKNVPANNSLLTGANSIISWIMNPSKSSISGDGNLLPDVSSSSFNIVDPTKIKPIQVDLGDESEGRTSPSQTAWSTARDLTVTGGFSLGDGVGIGDYSLFNQIVDVWVSFSNIDTTTGKNVVASSAQPNEYDIDQLAKTQTAVTARIQSFIK